MNAPDKFDESMRNAVEKTFNSITVPDVSQTAIQARVAQRLADGFPARRARSRFAFAALGGVILAGGVFAVPGLPGTIARAAQAFNVHLQYELLGTNGQAAQRGRSMQISLAQAQANPYFHFVEPKGLPNGSALVSVQQGPAFVHHIITLAYRTPDARTFLILESAVAHGGSADHGVCFGKTPMPTTRKSLNVTYIFHGVKNGNTLGAGANAMIRKNGLHQVPCAPTWAVNGTQLTISQGALTPMEAQSISRATKLGK